MAQSGLIAARYAQALFMLASEKKALDAVAADLAALADLAQKDPSFRALLESPLISRAQAKGAVTAIAQHTKAHALTGQFLSALADNRRLEQLPAAARRFGELVRESRGEIVAEIETASSLDAKQEKNIADSIAQATGKKVQVRARTNPALLGGVLVRYEGKTLDMSVEGRLRRLSQALRA